LLKAIHGCCTDPIKRTHLQITTAAFPTVRDDPRWISPFPLRPELQLRYLYFQAVDAFDVASSALGLRASSVGIGAVRFLAECHVQVRFLVEVTGSERQKRAHRLIQSGIDRVRKLGGPRLTGREADDAENRLAQIAREDGVQHVRAAPGREHLFKTYTKPGYVFFATLSELGSHPGFLHLVPFFTDPETRMINVNLSGAPWIALCGWRSGSRRSGTSRTTSGRPSGGSSGYVGCNPDR
jgi:hypothetical protein